MKNADHEAGEGIGGRMENAAAMEVEKALNTFPGISSTAVYGVSMPAGEGKAGMAAILASEGRSIDMAALAAHLGSALPKYAVPLFIRFISAFQMTATHKIKKTDFRKEGYGPDQVKDKLYVLLPGSDAYVPLDNTLYREIHFLKAGIMTALPLNRGCRLHKKAGLRYCRTRAAVLQA